MSDAPNDVNEKSADSQAPEESIDSLKTKLAEAQAAAEKYKNDFLYLRAEFDTARRNSIKERADLLKYGSERLINEILNVIDNFERALSIKISADNFTSYVKGVEMTAQELKSALGKFGVAEVASQGQAFDPAVHEALGSEPSPEVPVGHITKVLRKAYKLHDKLLRPGQVIVAQAPKE